MKQAKVALGASLVFAAVWPAAGAAGGSCVECHRAAREMTSLTHNFTDWQGSIHAKSGVECQACHGGDATQPTKIEAHAGLIPSTNPKSPVYYTQIPATCGKCHTPEFQAFRKSAHFNELEHGRNGPNCVTCHGAMASHVIDSQSMKEACSICHHQKIKAYQARAAMEEAQESLHRLHGEIQSALSKGLTDPLIQNKTYHLLADRLHQVKVDWHAFRTNDVLASAKDISQKAEAAFTELKSKNQNP